MTLGPMNSLLEAIQEVNRTGRAIGIEVAGGHQAGLVPIDWLTRDEREGSFVLNRTQVRDRRPERRRRTRGERKAQQHVRERRRKARSRKGRAARGRT